MPELNYGGKRIVSNEIKEIGQKSSISEATKKEISEEEKRIQSITGTPPSEPAKKPISKEVELKKEGSKKKSDIEDLIKKSETEPTEGRNLVIKGVEILSSTEEIFSYP